MTKHLLIALTSLAFCCSSLSATEWADKMFEVRTHDFGAVARGAKSDFVFELTNIYEEDVHISGVRANCGCVTPTIENGSLKTWEKGGIRATFNTSAFIGQRKAAITVTIDKPYFAEVQLNISGLIRNDIHFQPGVLDFQQAIQGQTPTRQLIATRYGNPGWKIQDVLCMNRNYEVVMKELERTNRQVRYQLTVKLLGSHKIGAINDELIIVSNDQKSPRMNVPMQGEVTSPLTLSPSSIDFGEVAAGTPVSRKVFLKASDSLEIQSVTSDNDCLTFETKKMGTRVAAITVTMTAKEAANLQPNSSIQIEVMMGKLVTVSLPVSATIPVQTAAN